MRRSTEEAVPASGLVGLAALLRLLSDWRCCLLSVLVTCLVMLATVTILPIKRWWLLLI